MSALESLKSHNQELASKYQTLSKEHNHLRESFEKLLEMREQSIQTLESTQKMQIEFERKENVYQGKIDELIGAVHTLNHERDQLVTLVDEKHRDVTILSSQVDLNRKR